MRLTINIEQLAIIDKRFLLINVLPRKKKKKLKKELTKILLHIANEEANRIFYSNVMESYKDLIKELEEVQSQISSIHEDHSQPTNE